MLRLLPPPGCIYYANLTSGWPMILIDSINAGAVMVKTGGVTGAFEPVPGSSGELLQPQAGFVQLSFTRRIDQTETAFVNCALTPAPTLLPRRYGMVGHFHLPADLGPSDLGVQWAAVIGVRDNTNKLVGATHQVRNLESDPTTGVQIALGVGSGAVAGSVTPNIDLTDPSVAYPDPTNRVFILETLIDVDAGTGTSWLRTLGKSWTPRTWQFAFQITSLAFGLAMVSGGGTPQASIDSFYIYDPKLRRWWWNWVIRLREVLSAWA
jgi:hypothetical protein